MSATFFHGNFLPLHCGYVTGSPYITSGVYPGCKASNQIKYPHGLVSAFVVPYLDSLMTFVSISEIYKIQLVSLAAQAG